MPPQITGKFVRMNRNDEIDVIVGDQVVTFRKLDSCRFEIIAHRSVDIHAVRKWIKTEPRLQPIKRKRLEVSGDEGL